MLVAGVAMACTSAMAEVLADFTGSTPDTAGTVPGVAGAIGVTPATNLNAGSPGGTWSTPTSTTTDSTGTYLVSSGAATGMTGNWLMIGRFGNDLTHESVAELTLGSAVALDGASKVSMNFLHMDAGGQDGGFTITGFSAGGRATGTALFQASIGIGGIWGQRDLNAVTSLDTAPTNLDNNLWGVANGNSINIAFNLGAAGYTMTGVDADSNPFNITGGYLGAGDLAVLEIKAFGSKAAAGIDDITVSDASGPAAPVSNVMISGPVLGGTAMVISWTSVNEKPYGVETNSNLILNGWQTFETGLLGN